MPSATSPLLLDKVPFWVIFGGTFGLVVVFGGIYAALDIYAPHHGLAPLPGEAPLRWWDYFYFSLVTQATVGYGDIRPLGLSRLAASIHALLGLIATGFMVAKFTTTAISRYRVLQKEACDYWVDVVRHRDGRIEVGLLILEWRGGSLDLSGRNFDPRGILVNSFHASLTDDDWPRSLTFRYTSDEAAADYVEGYVTIFFHASRGGLPSAFSATVRDHIKPNTKPVIRGWRVLPEEREHALRLNEHPQDAPAVDYFLQKYLPRMPDQNSPGGGVS
ncbi:MAG: hypothetical protein RL088_2017 [Verrucomicrobiota bacterium]